MRILNGLTNNKIKDSALDSLEFRKVLSLAGAYAKSAPARSIIMTFRPLLSSADVTRRLDAVSALRRLHQQGAPPSLSIYEDLMPVILKARPEDSVLEPLEISLLLPVLHNLNALKLLADGIKHDSYPGNLSEVLDDFGMLRGRIEKSFDAEGRILDSASHLLFDIRSKARSAEKRILKKLQDLAGGIGQFLQDEFVTRRSGRWVLPVRMDSKGQVRGVVHDVSRTGETAFIEPVEIMGLSDELENLKAEEKAEEIRILRTFTSEIRHNAQAIAEQFDMLTEFDALNSIAIYSELYGMHAPEAYEGAHLRLDGARHPLLISMKKPSSSSVVALKLQLGESDRVMVVTGPNAGGKTVTLKTTGLISLMALSGMHVPAESSSTIPVLDNVLVDIGDEQSIENSMSTFSAHVSNIASIINASGRGSLVLIDELGTGTDPSQGAALGCAILNNLMNKGALVIATTHLIDIVAYVHKTSGMTNACMEFNPKTMKPLYNLIAGEPGQSHAIEIAAEYGMPMDVIDEAKSLLGTAGSEFYGLLEDLRDKTRKYELLNNESIHLRQTLQSKKQDMDRVIKEAESERKTLLINAYEQAQSIVADAKRQVFDIIEEAKANKSRQQMKKAQSLSEELSAKRMQIKGETKLDLRDIEPGQTVFVRSLAQDAVVLNIYMAKMRVKVKSGGYELEVPADELSAPSGKMKKPPVESPVTGPEQDRQMQSKLNIVGKRTDEAIEQVEHFLNDSSMSGVSEVFIIHGIGTGALRKAVREHLRGHPLVEGFRKGDSKEGGDGVTVADLK